MFFPLGHWFWMVDFFFASGINGIGARSKQWRSEVGKWKWHKWPDHPGVVLAASRFWWEVEKLRDGFLGLNGTWLGLISKKFCEEFVYWLPSWPWFSNKVGFFQPDNKTIKFRQHNFLGQHVVLTPFPLLFAISEYAFPLPLVLAFSPVSVASFLKYTSNKVCSCQMFLGFCWAFAYAWFFLIV